MSDKIDLQFSWRVKPECGWGCEYLLVGIKRIGWYTTSMERNKAGVHFYGGLSLLHTREVIEGTREEVKVQLLAHARRWFDGALAGSGV